MRPSTACLLAAALAFPAASVHAQEEEPREGSLPVRRVVLYASGVGYFEHAGTVEDAHTLRLTFDKDQINDVLKSMTIMDRGGGSVREVTYPSQEPVERALRSFGVDISGNPSLPNLLNQLRGARVTVVTSEPITGVILNVTAQQKVVGEPATQVNEHTLHLVTDRGIVSIPMQTIARLELEDAQLREELNKALTLLATARNDDRKPVELRFEGEGERDVRVGYLLEMPVWKTSYRLDLSGLGASDGDGEGGDDGNAFLQGWAIVENTSDADWEDVELTLVSGQPISFSMDLYTPLFVPRPEAQVPRYASLQPRTYDRGMPAPAMAPQAAQPSRLGEREAMADGMATRSRLGRGMAGPAEELAKASESYFSVELDRAGVTSAAQASSLGELFRFTIDQPVQIERRQSAMLPIITQPIEAQKLSIYNRQVQAKHPLHGARLTNTTGAKLLGGPVTVLDGGAYAGDALIDHLGLDDERLLSYGIDLDVTVDPSQSSRTDLLAGRIVRGVLQLSYRTTETQTYAIHNNAPADRNLLIEHPFRNGWNLLKPESPREKTPELYRFELTAPAGDTLAFEVVEQRQHWQSFAILDTDLTALVRFSRQEQLSEELRNTLTQAAEMRQELSRLESRRTDIENQLRTLKEGQSRLRENLRAVGQNTQLGQRYLSRLAEEEDRIEALETELEDVRSEIEQKRKAFEDFLSSLNLD